MPAPAGIVTPEAVVLEFETAGLASRMLAALVDLGIQAVLLLTLALSAGLLVEAGAHLAGAGTALLYVAFFLLLFGYPAGFETLWRGRTPGKAALGLRVVTVEGGPIRFRHAAIRAMVGMIDKYLLTGVIGILSVLASRRNQRLGDMVAGTIVLRERFASRAPTAVAFEPPAGLEAYVRSLDVAALDHRDYAAVRSFLLRASSLTPPSRHALAHQLASPLVERLGNLPPTGVHPEVFLACVAAAYQRRGGGPARPPPFASVWADPLPSVEPPRSAPSPAAGAAQAGGFVAPG